MVVKYFVSSIEGKIVFTFVGYFGRSYELSLKSEMVAIIRNHNIRCPCESRDRDTFLKLIVRLSCDEKLRLQQSHNATRLFRNKFGSKIIYDACANHVENIAAKKGDS